ncbi:thiamine ABC transporter permease, partial [Vibrio parahaemolyticus]
MVFCRFAQRWRFPHFLPSRYSLRFWEYEWHSILGTLEQCMLIAVISATVALAHALIAHEYRLRDRWQVPGYIIDLPMMIPQLSVLFGMQVVTLYLTSKAYF